MPLTTIPLSTWMSSRWAFADTSRRDVASRKSTWSQQVESVYNGHSSTLEITSSQQGPKKKSPHDIYLENASAISYLLLEQMVASKSKETASGNSAIGLDGITVTLEIDQQLPPTLGKVPLQDLTGGDDHHLQHQLCIIKFVNITLHNNNNPEKEPGEGAERVFFRSLGTTLLKLFTRQEMIPNLDVFLTSEKVDSSEGEVNDDDSADFESAMMKALTILENEDSEEDGETRRVKPAPSVQKQKQQRRDSMESSAYSKICNQYSNLPQSLSRLISDLLDGPSRTKTSFTSLNDVLVDVKQMATEPDTFLHDPIHLTDVKLEFGNMLYGRKEEVSQMIDIANDVSSQRETGSLEIVSIGGYSGSGKSFLVQQVGQYLSSKKGWIFIRGKFDRMRQSDSFSVVTSAFENFCVALQDMQDGSDPEDREYVSQVSARVLESLGVTGVLYLSVVIPTLKRIIDLDSGSDSEHSARESLNGGIDMTPVQTAEEALMSQRKREYSIFVFLEAILGVGRKLLLFYDDIQWADVSTQQFLRKLLKHIADRNKARKNLIFAQAYRVNEAKDTELLASIFQSHDSVNITKIKLEGFSKGALNNILSPVLRLPRRITSPLSEIIHQKTMGNIFFVIEFIKTLNSPDKKILTFSLAKRRWVWDCDTISVMTISDNVAGLLLEKILCVEKTMMDALIIASCFGSQVNTYVMELLDGTRGVADIVHSLDEAVNEGLLEKAGPFFMFAHDSIQQAAYELIPNNELMKLHVDIGLMLISKGGHASRDMIEAIFTFAVSHINMALPSGENGNTGIEFTPSQHIVFAKLNLRAGQKALKKSDFSFAKVHLKAGISFLPENCWSDHYYLTLQLFDEYANVLFVQRDLEELNSLIDIILKNAKCTGDTIKAHELLISVLTLNGKTPQAMDHAISVLDTLGFPFPSSIDSETVLGVATSINSTTMEYTAEDIRSFPLMTEKIPLEAMKVLSAVHMPYTFSNPIMFQMMACQMMQLTMKHGLCIESSEAFANFGYCLTTMFSNYEGGYKMGRLSQAILDRFNATNRIAKVRFIIYGFLNVWKEPLQSTVEALQLAVDLGLREGDYKNVLFDQVVLNRQRFISGCELSELRNQLLSLCRDMMQDKVKKIFYSGFNPVLADLYFVMSLTGEKHDVVSSTFGITKDENDKMLLEKYSVTNNSALVQLMYYHRLTRSFLFRDYLTAIQCCEKYESYTQSSKLRRVTDIIQTLVWGLSSLILSRKKKQPELMAKGEDILMRMKGWAKLGSEWNAANKAYLLEAECHFAKGDLVQAKTAYKNSIQSAHEHKFIHEEALAYELYGIFCIEAGDLYNGNTHLEKARELYEIWGAHKKAHAIFDPM